MGMKFGRRLAGVVAPGLWLKPSGACGTPRAVVHAEGGVRHRKRKLAGRRGPRED
jgi:hypothetical protein